MDYAMLREKVELIIKGLECMQDSESFDDFMMLLNIFTEQQIKKVQRLKETQKSQYN